jgi:hypothetical protein
MESAYQPVRYIGTETANTDYHDGQLRPAIGVHSHQVLRANRTHPEWAEDSGWTYNHAPMLCHWNGRFYLEYLSNPHSEHVPPGQTLLTSSADGVHWEKPTVIFPIYRVPDEVYCGPHPLPPGSDAVMHQRMGFYVAPDGRLLVLGFYGCCPTTFDFPNDGWGIGRVVREVYRDGACGPIYFLRYNRHAGWNEGNTSYPFYRTAPDAGFIAACDALLANKLVTLQWWEEDRSQDGFYAVEGYKALSFYHLPDGKAVGLWKFSKAAITEDEGQTWSPVYDVPSLVMSGGKIWGQRTSDGCYALVYNPNPDGEHRWPLAVVTGDDGLTFDNLLVVNGEVAPKRFVGTYKDFGLNYVRGIVEGNGAPPDGSMWVTYSMNKEDIWVSRIPVPIRRTVEQPVDDHFTDVSPDGLPADWNVYSPLWAPVSVVDFPSREDRSLELRDADPHDCAKAERVFPESTRVKVEFKVMAKHRGTGQLYVELVDRHGCIAAALLFDADGGVKNKGHVLAAYAAGTWQHVSLTVDTLTHRCDLALDGRTVLQDVPAYAPIRSVERLVFRTGPRRREPTLETNRWDDADLPHADDPVLPAVFCVNSVKTSEHRLAP